MQCQLKAGSSTHSRNRWLPKSRDSPSGTEGVHPSNGLTPAGGAGQGHAAGLACCRRARLSRPQRACDPAIPHAGSHTRAGTQPPPTRTLLGLVQQAARVLDVSAQPAGVRAVQVLQEWHGGEAARGQGWTAFGCCCSEGSEYGGHLQPYQGEGIPCSPAAGPAGGACRRPAPPPAASWQTGAPGPRPPASPPAPPPACLGFWERQGVRRCSWDGRRQSGGGGSVASVRRRLQGRRARRAIVAPRDPSMPCCPPVPPPWRGLQERPRPFPAAACPRMLDCTAPVSCAGLLQRSRAEGQRKLCSCAHPPAGPDWTPPVFTAGPLAAPAVAIHTPQRTTALGCGRTCHFIRPLTRG